MNTGLIVLFVVLGICLLIGLPVAFSIGISCMALLTVNGYPPTGITNINVSYPGGSLPILT